MPSPPTVERPATVRSRSRAPASPPPDLPQAAPLPAPVVEPVFEHAPAIYGYLRRRVADGATAERLTVDAYTRAAAGATADRPASRIDLLVAAAAALRDARPELAPDDLDAAAVATFARALDPDLEASFQALTPIRQRILTLRYLDQLTPAEMAAVLDLRPAALKTRLAAAMRALDTASAVGQSGSPIEAVDAA